MNLKERLIKNSTVKFTSTLADSKIYGKGDMIPTMVPMINVALSGTIDGGLTPGLTTIAGPSKHFKTGFSLLLVSSFLKKYPEGVVLFYDTEFGTPQSYFESFNIDIDSVVHTPITNIEELKFDIMKQLGDITREDQIMIIIDSIGNIASKKEVDDALDGKSVADMTRAKQLKSLFRMITPHLTLKDIAMIAVNHTYKTQEMFSKDVVSGGTGAYYSSDNIWIVGRQQDKDGKELQGHRFIINIEKSRYVREKSKIPITISFQGGINRYSGLLDVALEGGYVTKPKQGWYARVDRETGEVVEPNMRASQIESSMEFWVNIFKDTDFKDFIEKKYCVSMGDILDDDEVGS